MASGITAHDSCIDEYNNFKLQNSKSYQKRTFLLFRIVDEKIQLCEQGGVDATWDDFVNALKSNPKDGCYGVYDFKAELKNGRSVAKIIFVSWTPDHGLPAKKKMMYASAREPFKQQLGGGLACCIQAADLSDLEYETITQMLSHGR
jgi:hypothetical protein